MMAIKKKTATFTLANTTTVSGHTFYDRDGGTTIDAGEGLPGSVIQIGNTQVASDAVGHYDIAAPAAENTRIDFSYFNDAMRTWHYATVSANTTTDAEISLSTHSRFITNVDLALKSIGVDSIQASGTGNITLSGSGAHNTLIGNAGHNTLFGFAGNDTLFGNAGNDTLNGGDGNDEMRGGTGMDVLQGGNGHDRLWGNADNDTLYGNVGNDTLNGDNGSDVLKGGYGEDKIFGGADNDALYGEAHNDALYGGDGHDHLFGGDGNDVLHGGTGLDVLTGGAGADRFVFTFKTGRDEIADFSRSQGDKIVIDRDIYPEGATLDQIAQYMVDAQDDGSMLISLNGEGTVIVQNCSELLASDFVWG